MHDTTLANWRQAPHNVWAFRHVDKILPTATIAKGKTLPLPNAHSFDAASVTISFEGTRQPLETALTEAACDGLLVLHHGKVVHEQYRHGDASARHILFSVSKSVTGILAGLLVGDGRLDPEAPVTRYVPEMATSAYGSATVRHVLDMTVDVTFVEDYLDTQGAFARYRVATGWNPPRPEFGELGLHEFLGTLPRGNGEHGQSFHYVSPNSDLLGWILERAGGEALALQLSRRLWQPMGAEADAFITVDRRGAARSAGGICTTLRDLARFGELIRCDGMTATGQQLVPRDWIKDLWHGGDGAAWQRGSMTGLFPRGCYRSQWYVSDDKDPALCAIGIHGQWIYVNPAAGVVIVKHASQAQPVDDRIERLNMAMFSAISAALNPSG
jgi:CubicO group peptidase (beta-lactamase class C family)